MTLAEGAALLAQQLALLAHVPPPVKEQSSELKSFRLSDLTSGDFGGGGTPVPISNTAVKPSSADDTGISRESRSLPEFLPHVTERLYGAFFMAAGNDLWWIGRFLLRPALSAGAS